MSLKFTNFNCDATLEPAEINYFIRRHGERALENDGRAARDAGDGRVRCEDARGTFLEIKISKSSILCRRENSQYF